MGSACQNSVQVRIWLDSVHAKKFRARTAKSAGVMLTKCNPNTSASESADSIAMCVISFDPRRGRSAAAGGAGRPAGRSRHTQCFLSARHFQTPTVQKWSPRRSNTASPHSSRRCCPPRLRCSRCSNQCRSWCSASMRFKTEAWPSSLKNVRHFFPTHVAAHPMSVAIECQLNPWSCILTRRFERTSHARTL